MTNLPLKSFDISAIIDLHCYARVHALSVADAIDKFKAQATNGENLGDVYVTSILVTSADETEE